MKPRTLLTLLCLAAPLAGGSAACSSGGAQPSADEPTAQTSQNLITASGTIMAWPMGAITWNGLTGTWPIAVWSPATIGAVAFDVAGLTGLGVTIPAYPNLIAAPITSAYLSAFVPTVATTTAGVTPFFGPAGLYAPAYGYTGAYSPYLYDGTGAGYGYGAFAPFGALQATYLNGAFTPGWSAWFTPALTSSALMFNNLAAIDAFTPYVFNVSFQAQSAAQAATITAQASMNAAALSIWATPILPDGLAAATAATTAAATTTAIAAQSAFPFMSMVYPVLPMPILPATAAAL